MREPCGADGAGEDSSRECRRRCALAAVDPQYRERVERAGERGGGHYHSRYVGERLPEPDRRPDGGESGDRERDAGGGAMRTGRRHADPPGASTSQRPPVYGVATGIRRSTVEKVPLAVAGSAPAPARQAAAAGAQHLL